MSILIRSITIIQPGHNLHSKKRDIRIEKGKITEIAVKIEGSTSKEFDGKGKFILPGLFDLSTQLCDPGMEYKENIESGLNAAADGGFTGICIQPSADPAVDSKADVEYLLGRAKGSIVEVYPLGAISKGRKGEELAELLDMFKSGAVAFTDDLRPVDNPALFKLALLYARDFGGKIMSFPFDAQLAHQGVMNEGVVSAVSGLKGIPNISEEIMVQRDLFLAEYTNAPIHFSRISTAGSVELIKEAKKKGLAVSCDVALCNLTWDDSALAEFDSNFKVLPPLRSATDKKALLKGVKNGVIDAVVSDHRPEDVENKVVEFDHARFGMLGLQTFASDALNCMDLDQMYTSCVKNPREILGLDVPLIEEVEKANLTIIDPELEWSFDSKSNLSLSTNSPHFNQTLKGRCVGLIKGSKYTL